MLKRLINTFFLLVIIAIILSGLMIILNHIGAAEKILQVAFGFIFLGTLLYLPVIKK